MLTFAIITFIILKNVSLYIYCRVKRNFAPEYTPLCSREFSKFDWEMCGMFSLFFGMVVPTIWVVRRGYFIVADKLEEVSQYFVKRIEAKEDERRRKAEDVVPVSDSYTYRKEVT